MSTAQELAEAIKVAAIVWHNANNANSGAEPSLSAAIKSCDDFNAAIAELSAYCESLEKDAGRQVARLLKGATVDRGFDAVTPFGPGSVTGWHPKLVVKFPFIAQSESRESGWHARDQLAEWITEAAAIDASQALDGGK